MGATSRFALYARVLARCLHGLPARLIFPRGGCTAGSHSSQGGIVAAKVCLAECGGGVLRKGGKPPVWHPYVVVWIWALVLRWGLCRGRTL